MVINTNLEGEKPVDTITTQKKILSPDDFINSVETPGTICGQHDDTGIWTWRLMIPKPDGEVAAWMFYHCRGPAKTKRLVRQILKTIRSGGPSHKSVPHGRIDLVADIFQRSRDPYSTRYYDLKLANGRPSFAFLVGDGYRININEIDLPEMVSKMCSGLPNSGGDHSGDC